MCMALWLRHRHCGGLNKGQGRNAFAPTCCFTFSAETFTLRGCTATGFSASGSTALSQPLASSFTLKCYHRRYLNTVARTAMMDQRQIEAAGVITFADMCSSWSMSVFSNERASLESDLRRARSLQQLVVHYQPKNDVMTQDSFKSK